VGDDLLGRRGSPLRLVLGRVSVADKHRVVAAHKRAVERPADALIGLSTDHRQPPNVAGRQLTLKSAGLERIAVVLSR
jgi:hypothetical protein